MIVRGGMAIVAPGEKDGLMRDDAAILVQEGKITEIGTWPEIRARHPQEEVIGNGEQLVMPGFIDAHSHGRGLSPLRGGLPYNHLESWLPRTGSIPNPGTYLNTMYSAVRHIRSGFTAMHYLPIPRLPVDLLEQDITEAMAAFEQVGIRAAISVSVKDQNLFSYDDNAFRQTLPPALRNEIKILHEEEKRNIRRDFVQLFTDLATRYHDQALPLLLAPAGPQWCSDDILRTIADLAEQYHTRVHLHALQTPLQKAYAQRKYKRGLIAHLHEIGLLGPRLTLGHAVWLTETEIDALARAGTSITHHAGCNLNMRNGIAPVDDYVHRGVRVALGLDDKPFSEDEDVFQEMRLINLLHRVNSKELGGDCLRPWDILGMATEHSAWVSGWGDRCGRLTPGACADLILIDTKRFADPWYPEDGDIRDLVIHQGLANDVNTVIVGGKVVMKDRKLLTIDEHALIEEFHARLGSALPPETKQAPRSPLITHLRAFYHGWEQKTTVPYYMFNSRI